MNREQLRAADKSARRAPPAPQRSTGNPHAALGLLRTTRAANSAEPLEASQRTDLAIGYHGALHSLMHGRGTFDDCITLASAVNIALLLCESGLGEDEMPSVQAAQEAIFRMTERGKPTRRFVLTGPEIRAIQGLLELHDAQLEHPECTESRLVWAIRTVRARVVAGNVLEVATA